MAYRYPQARLLIFCKAPIAGQVKTRLMPVLTAEQAADVHILLTKRLLTLLNEAQLCEIQLWCSPDCEHPFFQACANDYDLTLHRQEGADLGTRMQHAIATTLIDSPLAVLVGCDSPTLTVNDISEAIENLLTDSDVVLAPAEDGGYVMIASKGDYPTLFSDMTWSTENVLSDTIRRASQANIALSCIHTQWDIDTIEDWQRFCALE